LWSGRATDCGKTKKKQKKRKKKKKKKKKRRRKRDLAGDVRGRRGVFGGRGRGYGLHDLGCDRNGDEALRATAVVAATTASTMLTV
jgi:hypothetical protein